MKIGVVSNMNLRARPHLYRIVESISNHGSAVVFFGLEDEDTVSLKNLEHKCVHKRKSRYGFLIEMIVQFKAVFFVTKRSYLDLIIATHPYSLLLVTSVTRFRRNLKIIYYPGELYDARNLWHLRLIEHICYGSVGSLIVPNKPRLEYLINKYGERRGFILPNSTKDFPHFSRKNRNTGKDKLRLVYLGTSNIERRCLDTLISAIDKYSGDIELKLALGGRENNILKVKNLLINAVNSSRFHLLDYIPYPGHFEHMVDADVGVMLYHPDVSLNYKFCEPNKLYEYTMMGLAVLSSDQEHLKAEVDHFNFGVTVDPLSEVAILQGLKKLHRLKNNESNKRARLWFKDRGNYSKHSENLITWLTNEAR